MRPWALNIQAFANVWFFVSVFHRSCHVGGIFQGTFPGTCGTLEGRRLSDPTGATTLKAPMYPGQIAAGKPGTAVFWPQQNPCNHSCVELFIGRHRNEVMIMFIDYPQTLSFKCKNVILTACHSLNIFRWIWRFDYVAAYFSVRFSVGFPVAVPKLEHSVPGCLGPSESHCRTEYMASLLACKIKGE